MGLPVDIEIQVSEEGIYIELEGFIRFLRSDDETVPSEYQAEIKHLHRLANYLETQFAEFLAQQKLLKESFDDSLPN